MNSLKKHGPFVLTLVLIFIFGFIFRMTLVNALILPAASMIWGAGRLLASVDQNVYWIALILFCAVLIAWLILSRSKASANPTYNYKYSPPPRVTHWRTLLDEALREENARDELRKSMDIFSQAILAGEAGADITPPLTNGQRLNQFLSPETADYLMPRIENSNEPVQNIRQTIRRLCPRWLRRMNKKQIHRHRSSLDEMLAWMESELEIDNERY